MSVKSKIYIIFFLIFMYVIVILVFFIPVSVLTNNSGGSIRYDKY